MGCQSGFNYLSDGQPVAAGAVVVAIEGILFAEVVRGMQCENSAKILTTAI